MLPNHFILSNVFCNNCRSVALAGLFPRPFNPFLLERVLGGAVALVEDTEHAGERERSQFVSCELVGEVARGKIWADVSLGRCRERSCYSSQIVEQDFHIAQGGAIIQHAPAEGEAIAKHGIGEIELPSRCRAIIRRSLKASIACSDSLLSRAGR